MGPDLDCKKCNGTGKIETTTEENKTFKQCDCHKAMSEKRAADVAEAARRGYHDTGYKK